MEPFDADIMLFFGLATVLATFSKIWAISFPNCLVTLDGVNLKLARVNLG